MAYEQKDNSGALFRNDKGDNASRPDYTGDCLVDGKPKRMAAWLKDGKNGKFMSIKFDEPREQQQQAPAAQPQTASLDDEIPF
jgi:hypothetical protein